jgi:hypothetical protein
VKSGTRDDGYPASNDALGTPDSKAEMYPSRFE